MKLDSTLKASKTCTKVGIAAVAATAITATATVGVIWYFRIRIIPIVVKRFLNIDVSLSSLDVKIGVDKSLLQDRILPIISTEVSLEDLELKSPLEQVEIVRKKSETHDDEKHKVDGGKRDEDEPKGESDNLKGKSEKDKNNDEKKIADKRDILTLDKGIVTLTRSGLCFKLNVGLESMRVTLIAYDMKLKDTNIRSLILRITISYLFAVNRIRKDALAK